VHEITAAVVLGVQKSHTVSANPVAFLHSPYLNGRL